jgi:hypothetical protein
MGSKEATNGKWRNSEVCHRNGWKTGIRRLNDLAVMKKIKRAGMRRQSHPALTKNEG